MASTVKDALVVLDTTMDSLWYGEKVGGERSQPNIFQRAKSLPVSLQQQSRTAVAVQKLQLQSALNRTESSRNYLWEEEESPHTVSKQVQQGKVVRQMLEDDTVVTQKNIKSHSTIVQKSISEKVGFREKLALSFKRAFSVSSRVQSTPVNNINQQVASNQPSFYTLDESNVDYMSTMSQSQVGGSPATHSPAKSDVENIFAPISEEEKNNEIMCVQNQVGGNLPFVQLLQHEKSESSDIENTNTNNRICRTDQNEQPAIILQNFHGRTEEMDAELDDILIQEIKENADKVYCCSCLRQPF